MLKTSDGVNDGTFSLSLLPYLLYRFLNPIAVSLSLSLSLATKTPQPLTTKDRRHRMSSSDERLPSLVSSRDHERSTYAAGDRTLAPNQHPPSNAGRQMMRRTFFNQQASATTRLPDCVDRTSCPQRNASLCLCLSSLLVITHLLHRLSCP